MDLSGNGGSGGACRGFSSKENDRSNCEDDEAEEVEDSDDAEQDMIRLESFRASHCAIV